MSPSKDILTYKRKRPSSESMHEDCCSDSSHGCPSETAVDKDANSNEDNISKDQKEVSEVALECVVCGLGGNSLHCGSCLQPLHNQPHGTYVENMHCGRPLCSSCIRLNDHLASQAVPDTSISKTEKKIKRSDSVMSEVTHCHQECSLVSSSGERASKVCRGPLAMDISFGNNSDKIQSDMNEVKDLEFVGPKAPERSCKPESKCASVLETLKSETRDLLSKNKFTTESHENVETKWSTPLRTYSRKHKRKGVAETKSMSVVKENSSAVTKWSDSTSCGNYSQEAAPPKGSLVEHLEHLKLPGEDLNLMPIFGGSQGKMINGVSTCAVASLAPEILRQLIIDSIKDDGKKLFDGENTSKVNIPSAETITSQSFIVVSDLQKSLDTNSFMASSNNVYTDSSGGTVINEKSKDLHKLKPDIGNSKIFSCDGKKTTIVSSSVSGDGVSEADLDLCVPPSGKGFMVNHNMALDAGQEARQDKTESSRKSHASFLHEAGPSCKLNENTYPVLSKGSTYKGKGLQLFSENRTCDILSTAVHSEGTTCVGVEEKATNWLRSFQNQPQHVSTKYSLSLGMSLPADHVSWKRSKFLTTHTKCDNFIQDEVHKSSLTETPSPSRHKLMLDSIMSRTRALAGSQGGFSETCLPYASLWSDDELDYLWIGVRRHGRDNWHAMLKDPRLHFSSWRTARDLAERWGEEQSKLFGSTRGSQLQQYLSSPEYFPNHQTGFMRKFSANETQLSLGDLYSKRESSPLNIARFNSINAHGNGTRLLHRRVRAQRRRSLCSDNEAAGYNMGLSNQSRNQLMPSSDFPPMGGGPSTSLSGNGNLPHWLREVVNTPPPTLRPVEPSSPLEISSIDPRDGLRNKNGAPFHGLMAGDPLLSSSGISRPNLASSKLSQTAELDGASLQKPVDLINIDSDASSEETISDDRGMCQS